MSKRSLRWILLLLALVWVLAACGGTDTPEPEPTPEPGPTEPTDPVAPEAPTNLTVVDSDDGAVLTWDYAGEGATFTVYRRDAETEEPETPTDDPANPEDPEDLGEATITLQQVPGFTALDTTAEQTYTDTGAAAEDYEYAVTATVDGEESEAVSTETPTDPGTDPNAGPADIIVTSTENEGAGTLKAAIIEAADGSIIEIGSDIAGQTITFEGSAAINKNLTIRNAAGAESTVIDGNGASDIFFIPGTGESNAPESGEAISVTIQGLTLTNGASTFGGAIYNGQNLTLIDTIVSNSTATSGGGIYATSTSTLTLQGTTSVTGNSAVADEAGEGGVGGGINVTATASLTIEGTATVTGNTAATAWGGVFINTDATFTGDAASVSGNTPTDIGGPGFEAPGETPEEETPEPTTDPV